MMALAQSHSGLAPALRAPQPLAFGIDDDQIALGDIALFAGSGPGEAREARARALLTAGLGAARGASALAYVKGAQRALNDGKQPLAATYLALAVPSNTLDDSSVRWRLASAERLLREGVPPAIIIAALSSTDEIQRAYDPEQPRVPAGNGVESGQWTSENAGGAASPTKPRGIQIADEADDWSQYFPVPEYRPPAEEPPVSQITAQDFAEAVVPGVFFARVANEQMREGNFTRSKILTIAAIFDVAAAAVTLGLDEAEAAAARLSAKRAAQLELNKGVGRAYEKNGVKALADSGLETAEQVTIKPNSGPPVRADALTRDPSTKEIGVVDFKSSELAPLTPNQMRTYREIEDSGGTIIGRGKPGFEGGTTIPPTRVQIIRPKRGPR